MATKWAIVGAGNLARDFINALSALPKGEHEIVAIGAIKQGRADELAAEYNIPKAYGDFEEMAKDEGYDVAYIATIGLRHYKIAKLFMEAGKNVLVEKPMGFTAAQVKELADLAKEKDVFLLEAVFTRFLPLHQRVRELLKEDKIGKAKNTVVTFGQRNCHMPDRRLGRKKHGGGTVLDFGEACIQFILMVLEAKERPESITASSVGLSENGVDLGVSVSMTFKNRRIATFVTDLRVDMPCEATIHGTEGSITLGKMWWCGSNLTLIGVDDKISTESFPLPSGAKRSFISSAGQGLAYQAQEVRQCLLDGKKESEVMPLAQSLLVAEIADEINKQIGINFGDEKVEESDDVEVEE